MRNKYLCSKQQEVINNEESVCFHFILEFYGNYEWL